MIKFLFALALSLFAGAAWAQTFGTNNTATGPGWLSYDSSGNLKVTSGGAGSGVVTQPTASLLNVTTTPTAGTYTIAGCTVGITSASCVATSTVVNHVMIQNTSATANVACHWASGAAVLNASGSVQLGPGQSALWGPSTSGVPSGAMNCIASAASTPLYVEYN